MTQYNQSVENISKIISLFTPALPLWGISEIAGKLGFSKTRTYNLIRTLEKIGFLFKDEETLKYGLGTRIASIGAIAMANMKLNQKAFGLARELASRCGVPCRLGIWDGNAVLVTFSVEPLHVRQLPSFQAGPRLPAYSTALGRAIMAYMDKNAVKDYLKQVKLFKFTSNTKTRRSDLLKELAETKARGFSMCKEEMVHGGASIGAPIFNRENHTEGAVSLLGRVEDIIGSDIKNIASPLCHYALQISQTLGYGV